MQCPSCRFENMPGLDSCGRCGTTLGLAHGHDRHQSAAGFQDRQAGAKSGTDALDLPGSRRRGRGRRVVSGSIVDDSRVPLPTPEVLSRLVVPGWAHIHLGMPARGQVFMLAYLPLLFARSLVLGDRDGRRPSRPGVQRPYFVSDGHLDPPGNGSLPADHGDRRVRLARTRRYLVRARGSDAHAGCSADRVCHRYPPFQASGCRPRQPLGLRPHAPRVAETWFFTPREIRCAPGRTTI